MLSGRDKQNILIDVLITDLAGRELQRGDAAPVPGMRLYAWRPGSDDVKIIAALDDESAARIAVRARMDHNEMSEMQALEYVTTRDELRRVDPDMFFQGEAPLWDGLRDVADAVGGA